MFSASRAPILHRHKYHIQMYQNEISHDLRYLGVPSGIFKMISEPMVRLAQTVQLSCDKISTNSKQTKTSFHLSLVNLEYHRVHPKQFLSLGTFGTNRATIMLRHWYHHGMDWNETPHEPHHPGVPSASSKLISKPRVRLAQTVTLSCTNTNTVSKQTKTRFAMTHVT
jgi:hypothetical protein